MEYDIVKAKAVASCTHYTSFYELELWNNGDDLDTRGHRRSVSQYDLRTIAKVMRGDGFKKINEFLKTEEGLAWISKYILEQDFRAAKDKIKDDIRLGIYKIENDLEKLEKVSEYIKMII